MLYYIYKSNVNVIYFSLFRSQSVEEISLLVFETISVTSLMMLRVGEYLKRCDSKCM